jgi:hypothetical protein
MAPQTRFPGSWDPLTWGGDAYDAIKGGGEWVLGQFGRLTNLFVPSVTVHAQLRATSSDPAFQGQELVKGWGKNAGKPIGIPGVRVNLWYMSLSVLSPYGGTTDAEGKMSTEVPKYFPFAGIEIPLNGDAADLVWNGMVTHTLTDYPNDLNTPSGDKTAIIRDHKFLNYLAQFSDGRDYLKTMVGYTPHKVVAATGDAANFLASFNNGRPVATCADFPNLVFSGTTFASWVITAFLAVTVSPALLAAIPLANTLNHSDIWLPDSVSSVVHSRGVWTHEYGHFALCSMIASEGEALSTLTSMTMETIFAGQDFGPDAEARILNEAFADFFTAQVVGGTNYYAPEGSLDDFEAGEMNYCIVPPCLERNMSETATARDIIARDITIFMDAFDGHDGSAVPNAADSWVESAQGSGTLTSATSKYANSCLPGNNNSSVTCDERVALPGTSMYKWAQKWLGRSLNLTHDAFMGALAETALEQANWCEVCRLFAIHTPGNEVSPGPAGQIPISQYSNACLSSPLKDWIGPPPDASVTNLDRVYNPDRLNCIFCPEGSTPGADGVGCVCGPHQAKIGLNCLPCGPNEIVVTIGANQSCKSCGPGTPKAGEESCLCDPGAIQSADGSCVAACGSHEVWQGGMCVDCGPGPSYPVDNVCLSCPNDSPLCVPAWGIDGLCHGNCVSSCGPCYEPPAPGSQLCGVFTEANGCSSH